MTDLVKGLEVFEEPTLQEIFKDFLNDKNIELKTDLPNSMIVSRARLAVVWTAASGCPETAKLLSAFIEFYVRDRVSQDGKRTTELLGAISGLMNRPDRLTEKLLGMESSKEGKP